MTESTRLQLPGAAQLAQLARAAEGLSSLDDLERLRAATSPSHAGLAGLHAVVAAEPDLEQRLVGRGGLLAEVTRQASRVRALLPDEPALLVAGQPAQLALEREAVLSLLCALFIGCIERNERGTYPMVNLSRWLAAAEAPQVTAKLRCLIEYFARTTATRPRGTLVIERRVLEPVADAAWWAAHRSALTTLAVHDSGVIEQAQGCTQADFANRYIGGGVLGGGCVQEEIRFSVSSELLVSLLLCEAMHDHEAIVLRGSEQFSRTRGYAFRLRFEGGYDDPCARATDGTPLSEVVAIDAIPFGRPVSAADQLAEPLMLREANKALVGFLPTDDDQALPSPLASGNWGCGAFGGHVQVKAIVQWLAASAAGRELRYYTFGDERLGDLAGFVAAVRQRGATVGELWRAALAASAGGASEKDVYAPVLAALS